MSRAWRTSRCQGARHRTKTSGDFLQVLLKLLEEKKEKKKQCEICETKRDSGEESQGGILLSKASRVS